MYRDKTWLHTIVRWTTKLTWRFYGEDPNAHLWNIVERHPWSWLFNSIIPCNTPYVLLEYPKCGMTWTRYMIYQATSIRHPEVSLADAVGEVQYRHLAVPRIRCTVRFLFDRRTRKKGILFLVRQPERVMVSNYNHTRYRLRAHEMDLHEFIHSDEYGIHAFVKFVESNVEHLKAFNHITVRYEDLRADTAAQLTRILEFIDMPLSSKEIDTVVRNSTFDAMRNIEQERRFDVEWLDPPTADPRAARVRSGGKEKLEELFSREDLEYMRSAYGGSKTFQKLGYAPPSDGAAVS
jgi:hypothetical protein